MNSITIYRLRNYWRYTMRRKDREITDISKIEEIIAGARYLHLGLHDEPYPYVVPLHFGYTLEEGRLTFYVHCAGEGHKLNCIKANPNVFVQIDRGESLVTAEVPCGYSAEFESVMARGRATILESAEDKIAALNVLMNLQAGKEFEFNERMVAAVTVIRIDVDEYTAKAHQRG